MGGLRRKNNRCIRLLFLPMHPVTSRIDLVKSCVAVPGLVEMEIFRNSRKCIFDKWSVVTEPVVRGVGQHGHRQLLRPISVDQRARLEFGTDRCLGELIGWNRSDDAVSVTRRDEVDRNRTDHLDHLLQ